MAFAPIQFIKEAQSELRQVAWPSRELTIRYTVAVIVSSVALGLLAGAIDYVLTLAVERIIIK